MEYTCTYTIEVTADSPAEAAHTAEDIVCDRPPLGRNWTVTDLDGDSVMVDLEVAGQ